MDLSGLASEVFENVTALLGRLVLEFMQRNPERGKFPGRPVLEEAHHYIPANARLERQERAREVFEKIAKEGRKFGLSLVVASQRPERVVNALFSLNATASSSIEFRTRTTKNISRALSAESIGNFWISFPALAQQQAIVLGDCVALPLQVRINPVDIPASP